MQPSMSALSQSLPFARLGHAYWRLRALLVILPWQLRTPLSRPLLACRPGLGQALGHLTGYLMAALMASS